MIHSGHTMMKSSILSLKFVPTNCYKRDEFFERRGIRNKCRIDSNFASTFAKYSSVELGSLSLA